MSSFTGGFEDSSEEEFSSLPLPRDDRLWRHPSELGGAPLQLGDPTAVRRRWLEHETTRASAWTAGIVGAVLATGLVALGTHLATALTSSPISQGTTTSGTAVPRVTTDPAAITRSTRSPSIAGIGSSLTERIRTVGESLAFIDVGSGVASVRCLGVVIGSNGLLLMPAVELKSATSLLVTLANGAQYVGTPAGSDAASGLAVVRINGVQSLPTVKLSTASADAGAMALAVTSVGGSTYSLGTVQKANIAPSIGSTTLVNALETDIPSVTAPLGSAILNGDGDMIGMVTGANAQGVVVTPSWLARPVANELAVMGRVRHGWLGMVSGKTAAIKTGDISGGVLVEGVQKKSAAFEAGLRTGDVITSLDGQTVSSLAALRGRLYVLAPGAPVHLTVLRDRKKLDMVAPLDDAAPN